MDTTNNVVIYEGKEVSLDDLEKVKQNLKKGETLRENGRDSKGNLIYIKVERLLG